MGKFINDAVEVNTSTYERGVATFAARSEVESAAMPAVRAYISSLDATVLLEDADVETQKRDDIDLFWTRSFRGDESRLSIEVKCDTKIHTSGNVAFETISNEVAGTRGCFMRSRADYLYYLSTVTGDLWIVSFPDLRSWFTTEMASRPARFPSFRTFSDRGDGTVSTARGYLVPMREIQSALPVRHRRIPLDVSSGRVYDDSPF